MLSSKFGRICLSVLAIVILSSLFLWKRQNTRSSTAPNIVLQQKPLVNLQQQFSRHEGFDHDKKNKLWENLDDFALIIRRLAYYDTRSKSDVAIVLLTLFNEQRKNKPDVHVLVTYNNNRTFCTPAKFWIKSGKFVTWSSEFYVNYMVRTTSTLPYNEKPVHVALTKDATCHSGLTGNIPVQGVEPLQSNVLKYGVCLHKALFGQFDNQLVVDWIELHKQLGAEFITIYLQNPNDKLYKLIKPYTESGSVEVLDWYLGRPYIPFGYTRDYGQSGVINECIYRNMNRVKYLALIDIDEFIVPAKKYRTVQDIIPKIEGLNDHTSAYVFYNTHFYEDSKAVPEVKNWTNSICSKMKIPRYFLRTQKATNPRMYKWHKMVVKPTAVNSAQVHFIVKQQSGYVDMVEVPESIGGTYHYRKPYRDEKLTPHIYSDEMGQYVNGVMPGIKKHMC